MQTKKIVSLSRILTDYESTFSSIGIGSSSATITPRNLIVCLVNITNFIN